MFRAKLLFCGLSLLGGGAATAHEIPSEVVARMLTRADGNRFQLVLRVPLNSMRDVEVPEFGPGYLDIAALEPQLTELATQWIVPFVAVYENGERLPAPSLEATQISLPSDRSFADIDRALAHVAQPKPANEELLVWDQVMFDVLLHYPIQSDRAEFSLQTGLGHLAERVLLTLQFHLADGTTRAYQFSEDPGRVFLDPSWFQAAWHFVQLGFVHILDGLDHLLFLFCLVIPLRRFKPLALIVTAFTVAHSITLIASALDFAPDALWFPPLVETLIAVSILYMALENIVGSAQHRWLVALGFGLIHGFGFSFALRETLQFAGEHLVTSLLAFNVGVELGQLFALVLLVPTLSLLFRFVVAERLGTIILSAFAAHEAWHWTMARVEVLGQYDVPWGEWLPTVVGAALLIAAVAAGTILYRRRRAVRTETNSGPSHQD